MGDPLKEWCFKGLLAKQMGLHPTLAAFQFQILIWHTQTGSGCEPWISAAPKRKQRTQNSILRFA